MGWEEIFQIYLTHYNCFRIHLSKDHSGYSLFLSLMFKNCFYFQQIRYIFLDLSDLIIKAITADVQGKLIESSN